MKTDKLTGLVFVVVVVIAFAAFVISSLMSGNNAVDNSALARSLTETEAATQAAPQQTDAPENMQADVEPMAGADDTAQTADTMVETTPILNEDGSINMDAVLAPRAYGNPDAPVVIEEYASLSCGHCAQFYNKVLPKLKAKYIDTGQVYFVYHDFPLNAPALTATVIARCMPQDRYFTYVSYLYKSQDSWAYEGNYENILKQNAKLAGGNGDAIEKCLADDNLRAVLVGNMQTAAKDLGVNSTPTFIINGKKAFSGVRSLGDFESYIQGAQQQGVEPAE